MTAYRESWWRFRHHLAVLLLAALTGLLYLPWTWEQCSPLVTCYNSGVFLAMGEQMAGGATPYRDVWDHKPPLVFYLNEAGVRLGRAAGLAGPCAVLLVCLPFTFGFFAVMYAMAAPVLGALPALIGILLACHLLPALALTPNETQAFALPLEALSLLLLEREWSAASEAEGRPLFAVAQGAIGALLLLLQPNLIGATFVYGIAVAFLLPREQRGRRLTARLSLAAIGFAATCGAVLLLFLHGAVRDFFYAAFQFNFQYSGLTTLHQKLVSIYVGFTRTSVLGASPVAVAVAAAVAIRRPLQSAAGRLAMLGAMSLGVEAALSAVSGRDAGGYYLTWLPAIVILASYLCHVCLASTETGSGDDKQTAGFGRLVLVLLLVALVGFSAAKSVSSRGIFRGVREKSGNVVRVVQEASGPSDQVLVWGMGALEIPYRLGRRPGSRVFQSAPLTHDRSLYRELAPWILSDVERNEAAFVIELASPELPGLFAGELERQHGWQVGAEDWDTPELKAWKARLAERYRVTFVDPDVRAVVYQRKAE
jgi:hypothetical protein